MSEFRWAEAQSLLCGDKLGEGQNRKVYVCRLDEAYVIKIEPRGTQFQNVEEWRAWWWAQGTSKARWLAPCKFISPCGLLLIQARVTPMRPKEAPKRLPQWLGDLKHENFGVLDGKVVACDYGTILSSYRHIKTDMRPARWKK